MFYNSNHERGTNTHLIRFLERNCIPYHCLHLTNEIKREKEILDLVKDTDFLVLARYMQVSLCLLIFDVKLEELVVVMIEMIEESGFVVYMHALIFFITT